MIDVFIAKHGKGYRTAVARFMFIIDLNFDVLHTAHLNCFFSSCPNEAVSNISWNTHPAQQRNKKRLRIIFIHTNSVCFFIGACFANVFKVKDSVVLFYILLGFISDG